MVLLAFFAVTCAVSIAQDDDGPVKITFDGKSERIDLVTGKKLPNYTLAQRGSIRFYLDRLDSPDDFFNFFHDGINKGRIGNYFYMEKVQPQFDVWRIVALSGFKNTPRIHHKAVSFIPLSPETNEPERKVYVRLDDLKKIEWKAMD